MIDIVRIFRTIRTGLSEPRDPAVSTSLVPAACMDAPSTVGRGSERLVCQRPIDYLRIKTSNGVRAFPLSELAEATGLAPRTVNN